MDSAELTMIARGNRKLFLAMAAMVVIAIETPLLVWLKAGTDVILATHGIIGAVAGVTGWFNVKTHQAQGGREEPREQ